MIFKKKETVAELDDVLDSSWRLLRKGVRDFRHPFYRSALATVDGGKPEVRTVILRGFSETDRTLTCFCDARTPKVSQIQECPHVGWLFYHPKKRIQLRLSGTASVHTDDPTAEALWAKVRRASRLNYGAEIPPGSPVEKPSSGLPDVFRDRASGLLDCPEARIHFAAIVCQFDQMDWLMLRTRGHLRAKFQWGAHRMDASWVIP